MGVLQFLQGAERQINIVDNNQTFKNRKGNQKTQSAPKQILSFLGGTGKDVRDIGVATARAVPRAGATIGKSIGDVTNPALGLPKVPAFDPSSNPVSKIALGSEPIKSIQQREAETQQSLQGSRFHGVATPLAIAGTLGSVGLDAAPVGGPGKNAVEKAIQDLAKAKTPAEVRNIMKGTPPDIVDKVVGPLTLTKDPHTVRRIIDQAISPSPPRMVPNATPLPEPTPIKNATIPAGQGTTDEQFANNYLKNNREKAVQDYNSRIKQEFGVSQPNVISADDAKFVIPNFGPSKTGYHEPSSDFVKSIYKDLLTKPENKGKDVLFTAGGTGAGKTVALRGGKSLDDYAAVYDSNLKTAVGASQKIDQALNTGHPVIINYVYRDPLDAFANPEGGVLQRANKTGRTLPVDTHVDTHVNSLKTVQQLAKRYQDNPNVEIRIIDNTRGKNNSIDVPIEFLKNKGYNESELRKALHEELDKAHSTGQISPEVYQGIKAPTNAESASRPNSQGTIGQPQPQRQSGDVTPPGLREATIPQSGEVIPPRTNPVQSVVEALRGQPATKGQTPVTGLSALQQRQKELYSTERGARLKTGATASEGLTGREALKAQLHAQKGELPRVNADALLEHLRSKVSPNDVENILTHLQQSTNLRGYEPITAQNAIVKLFDEGKLPTPSESKILEKALGPEFNDALKSSAEQSLSKGQKVKNFAVDLIGAPRSILAVDPASAWLRQGAVLGARFPKEFAKAQAASIKFLGSEKAYQATLQEIADRPTAELHKKMGISLAGPNGIKEEPFQSTLAERIPYGPGKVVRAADRGYTGFLSKLRADSADHIIGDLQDAGIDPNNLSDKQLKAIGRYINTSSGRGNLGALEKHATSLTTALFSPRLWKSRLDLLNPKYYYDLKGPARKYALQSAGSFAGIAATVLGLAAYAGAQVETDARSSDFLKIKVGDTRYDILGGLQQNLVLGWRELSGEKKSSQTGKVTDLTSGDFGASNRLSILSDFVQNKENPVFSTGARIIKGTDVNGQKVNPVTEVGKLAVPLGIQDTYQTVKNASDNGVTPASAAKGIAKTLPTNVGVGIGTYGLKNLAISKKQQAYVDSLKGEQATATKTFFQTLKTGPDRTKALADIKAAPNDSTAIKIAQDYNNKYSQSFNDWRKKYGKYKTDETLVKSFEKRLINDTSFNKLRP